VIISDVAGDRAKTAAEELAANGAKVAHLTLDVTDVASVEAGFQHILDEHGKLDVLVNNAGIGINAPFVDFKLSDFELSLKVNLTGAFLCGQAAARQMIRQGSGKIINIVSLSGQRGGMGRAGYGASKAGLELLTKVMAVELAPHGIHVNGIAPGPIETELSRVVHAAGGTRDAYLFLTPQHRYGEPAEIAYAALFLASGHSDYVNGHILNVDGGFGAAGLMYPLPSGR
jgi:NAD(P)-dependent dehydrogenase (short-subunit alcohol dehydrogenase family)